MEHLRRPRLLDESGNPFNTRVEGVLAYLVPRCQRQFPALRDDLALTEVLEEAGKRIARREARSGPIEKLHGYAWVTIRSVAQSFMRRGSSRLGQKTLGLDEARAAVAHVPADSNTLEQIERETLFRELFAQLTPDERLVCASKLAGFTSEEIAKHRGGSTGAVDTLFSRARQKFRNVLGVQHSEAPRQEQPGKKPGSLVKFPSDRAGDIERADGK
jgi:RNA polymerase sigma factor (sigma-70 family)